ncbi:ABC transporter ATP-binding protein [Candidatus Oscillochloris fontis]|uniref:ABC transporter ATP-binding protein n=1 Tax=Candidatus Oscillochloris fontis TaxID=2496868 RepID=UPI001EE942D7|nr:ABC transporter ATP-binding protein [Candidatus Oscillochloris fontis]
MSRENDVVIEIDDLSKSYGHHEVLRGLSLRVEAGEVYGLLGPNGAGKSTLLHLLLGFLKPTAGHVRVLGSSNLERMRAQIGYIPERQRYHTRYTAREYLRFMGEMNGLYGSALSNRLDELIILVDLEADANRMLSTFSKGMLQRLGVAQALLGDPNLLLIDEPTSGLDPVGQRAVLDLLASLRDRGHTVFLCTHYLHEIEYLCDRVGVLARGQIAAEAWVHDLRIPSSNVMIEVDRLEPELRTQLQTLSMGITCEPRIIQIRQNTPQLQTEVLQLLINAGVAILSLAPLESPLEQFYSQAVQTRIQMQHAGSTDDAGLSTTAHESMPVARPTGEGETLLNELLRRNSGSANGETNKPE